MLPHVLPHSLLTMATSSSDFLQSSKYSVFFYLRDFTPVTPSFRGPSIPFLPRLAPFQFVGFVKRHSFLLWSTFLKVASLDFEKVINFISKLNRQMGIQIVATWAGKVGFHCPGLFKLYILQRKAYSTIMIPDAQKGETICFPKQSLLLERNKFK